MHRLGEIVKKESFNKYVTQEVVAIVQDLDKERWYLNKAKGLRSKLE